MRILLISSGSGSRGGGELALVYLARALRNRGHEVAAWLPAASNMDELAERLEREVAVLRSPYQNTYLRRGRSLATVLAPHHAEALQGVWASFGADVIHVNKQNLEDGLDLLRAVAGLSVRHLCMIHITQSARWLGAKGGWLRDGVARWALRRYPGVFLTTPETRVGELRSFLGQGLEVVRSFVNGTPVLDAVRREAARCEMRKSLGLAEDEILVAGVGRMVAQKRPLRFLEAVARLWDRLPTLRFVWVGEGEMRAAWVEKVAALGLGDQEIACSWVDDAFPWLAAADVFLHTAAFEGLPFALLEALSHGLPCLMEEDLLKELPPLQDAVIPLDTGGLWLEKVLEPDVRRAWGVKSQGLHTAKFSLEAMAECWEKIVMESSGNPVHLDTL